jgi:hypothetical protein
LIKSQLRCQLRQRPLADSTFWEPSLTKSIQVTVVTKAFVLFLIEPRHTVGKMVLPMTCAVRLDEGLGEILEAEDTNRVGPNPWDN